MLCIPSKHLPVLSAPTLDGEPAPPSEAVRRVGDGTRGLLTPVGRSRGMDGRSNEEANRTYFDNN